MAKYFPKENTKIDANFFARDSESVARDLLGKILVKGNMNGMLYAQLNEIAPWSGNKDSMVEQTISAPGTLFVLPRFGKNVLGIATGKEGIHSCVTLIGGNLYNRKGLDESIRGPGNLSKALDIDKPTYDGVPIDYSDLWIGGESVDDDKILFRSNSF